MSNDSRDSRRGDRSTTISNPITVGGGTLDTVTTVGNLLNPHPVSIGTTGSVSVSNPTPTITVGNQEQTLTTNPTSQDLLAQILKELKINNAYLAEWQGYAIKEQDIS